MLYTLPPSHIQKTLAFFAPTTYQITSDATTSYCGPKYGSSTDEAWFSSEIWQIGEREANSDIQAGNVVVYESGEESLASL